ncbi:hypothetical protein CVT25_013422 [Psilocybe cyanescens]|uniref:DUF5648 domain-containing protein n=1 Tax=Psilocybe cyanescens TaxID=93625 RepID=A0A409WST9_PSICY|nr:hypothetical protein CVT25_013422 [Psilocybe cyanescens]
MYFIFTVFATLLTQAAFSQASAAPQRRSAETCADPSLTVVWSEAYSAADTAHVVSPRWLLTSQRSGGADWELQGDMFLAWQTPQEFTTPFYRLFNPTTTDWITAISTNGAAPVVQGFGDATIIGYAYSTQVCGSVPLLGASLASKGDHYYTTSTNDHASLLANGWVDAGIAAFVLPLSSGMCSLPPLEELNDNQS